MPALSGVTYALADRGSGKAPVKKVPRDSVSRIPFTRDAFKKPLGFAARSWGHQDIHKTTILPLVALPHLVDLHAPCGHAKTGATQKLQSGFSRKVLGFCKPCA